MAGDAMCPERCGDPDCGRLPNAVEKLAESLRGSDAQHSAHCRLARNLQTHMNKTSKNILTKNNENALMYYVKNISIQ